MVPHYSYEIPRASYYSGYYLVNSPFKYWTLTIFGLPSHAILLDSLLDYVVLNPYSITTVGLGSSYFARHYFRNRFFFLFLWVLRCFSSPRSLSYTTLLMYEYTSFFPSMSSLIRISTARWIFAPPRSFSQLITSFIGSWCQGIHPTLLVA